MKFWCLLYCSEESMLKYLSLIHLFTCGSFVKFSLGHVHERYSFWSKINQSVYVAFRSFCTCWEALKQITDEALF